MRNHGLPLSSKPTSGPNRPAAPSVFSRTRWAWRSMVLAAEIPGQFDPLCGVILSPFGLTNRRGARMQEQIQMPVEAYLHLRWRYVADRCAPSRFRTGRSASVTGTLELQLAKLVGSLRRVA